MDTKNIHQYEDIINMPHPVSNKHPQMTMIARAAQFAPFAALTGHGAAINETGRLTDKRRILDEHKKVILDELLAIVSLQIKEHPRIKVTYFKEDSTKDGGVYLNIAEEVKKIDAYERVLFFMNGDKVKIDDIFELEI